MYLYISITNICMSITNILWLCCTKPFFEHGKNRSQTSTARTDHKRNGICTNQSKRCLWGRNPTIRMLVVRCTYVLLLYTRITAVQTYYCYTYVFLLYIRITAVHTYYCYTYVFLLYIRITAVHTYYSYTYVLLLYPRITTIHSYHCYTYELLHACIQTHMHIFVYIFIHIKW